MALTKVTDSIIDFDSLEILTSASDTGVDLTLNGNKSSNGAVASIIFENNTDSVAMIRASRVGGNNDAADLQFFTQATGGSNTERARILSTGGITFNGDTATANALDDYEEGTWRPTISGSSSAGSYTYGENAGVYTKIGNQVTATFYIVNIAQSSAGSGNLQIDNLPFTAANITAGTIMDYYWGSCNLEYFDVHPDCCNIAPAVDAGTTKVLFWETLDDNVNSLTQITDLTNTTDADIWGQVTYRTT
jgi:hypothetical protein